MTSQAKKKVFNQNKNEYTNTHIQLATQWSGMQFVALQSGREESLPSIGRTQKRKRAKRKRHVYRVIPGQTENQRWQQSKWKLRRLILRVEWFLMGLFNMHAKQAKGVISQRGIKWFSRLHEILKGRSFIFCLNADAMCTVYGDVFHLCWLLGLCFCVLVSEFWAWLWTVLEMEQIITLAGWECHIHSGRKSKIHQRVSIEPSSDCFIYFFNYTKLDTVPLEVFFLWGPWMGFLLLSTAPTVMFTVYKHS